MPDLPAQIDTSRPSAARVHDCWLGGYAHFPVDKQLADEIEAAFPGTARHVREARAFLTRAVACAAGTGIRQYLHAGASIPAGQAARDTARAAHPGARIVYSHHDAADATYARHLLAGADPCIAAVRGDIRDAAGILAQPGARELLDPGEPLCVILHMVLMLLPADQARESVAGFAALMAPGSMMIVSAWVPDGSPESERLSVMLAPAAPVFPHSADDVASWLDSAGLETAPPGVAGVRAWPSGWAEAQLPVRRPARIVGAVATVPPAVQARAAAGAGRNRR
jgi:hypothetical protein